MAEDPRRVFENKAQVLIEQYKLLLKELGAYDFSSYPEFRTWFNSYFQEYQNNSGEKLTPNSLREGKVSCSSAAALVGLWFVHRYPQTVPYFLIQLSGTTRTADHAYIAVRPNKTLTLAEAQQLLFVRKPKDTTDIDDGIVIDWTSHSLLKPANTFDNTQTEMLGFPGLLAYMLNRVKVFSPKTAKLTLTPRANDNSIKSA